MKRRYLHHYTSTDGFYHIVKDHTIRMTSTEFMNDPSDCTYFLSIAAAYIEESEKCRNALKRFENTYHTVYSDSFYIMDYLEYVLYHISLCAMSFTEQWDSMELWNNYGRGGMEMVFDLDLLIDALRSTMKEREYLICSEVTYFPFVKQNLDSIGIKKLSESRQGFICSGDALFNEEDIASENEEATEIHRLIMGVDENLYAVDQVGGMIRYFVTSYLFSLESILSVSSLKNMSREEVYQKIFCSMVGYEETQNVVWRRDLLLCMITMSASIKVDSYEFEKESRIVYFDLGIGNDSTRMNDRKDIYVRKVEAGEIICPCVKFKTEVLNRALVNIVISPLTLNIPIDNERYAECLRDYLHQIGYVDATVSFSANDARWV